MNTGWHRSSFEVPLSSNESTRLWPQDMVTAFYRLFNFGWAEGGRGMFKFVENPLLARERGVAYFGGLHEYVLLHFDPKDSTDIPRRVLQMGFENADAPMEPDALSVKVHSGLFPDEDLHWVEMYDPASFQRRRMNQGEFAAYANNLTMQAKELLDEKLAAAYDLAEATDTWSEYFRMQEFTAAELVSSALLLASLFAPKRIPYQMLLHLRLAMPDYASAYACAKELPDDGSAAQIPVKKLVLLYGKD